jgi:hypothetical protein
MPYSHRGSASPAPTCMAHIGIIFHGQCPRSHFAGSLLRFVNQHLGAHIMKTRLSRCRARAGCKMRHSPVHKGERVTHVEQRVNYIIIKINLSIAAAANARALAAFQHQLIKIMLHRWLGLLEKCAVPPLKLILATRVGAFAISQSAQRCLLRILMHIAISGVQRESERRIHNNNNNIMLFLREVRAPYARGEARSSMSRAVCIQSELECVCCVYATGKSQ